VANRNLSRPWTYGKGLVSIPCKWTIGASGAVGTLTGAGVASVTRTSAGLYRITLSDVFSAFHNIQVTLLQATVTDRHISVKAYSASGKTVDVHVWDQSAGAVTDPESGDEIHVLVVAKNSGV